MGYSRITPKQKALFVKHLNEGMSIKQAAATVGVSYAWAKAHTKGLPSNTTQAYRDAKAAAALRGPIPLDQLSDRAKRGLEDFEFFRRTYLGHISMPWQVESAYDAVARLASPHKEFVVENMPPGSGKTTLKHDIAAWMTCRNRGIRGMVGSATSSKSMSMLRRLRKTLERTSPYHPPTEHIDAGMACVAEATLAQDYGLFRPPINGDLWRADQFVVMQHDDTAIDEKESTWVAWGMDQDFLGGRYDLIFWDDVVTTKHVATLEAIEKQREWWDREAESRLEPRGVLFLVGQRIASNDLYRHNLDKKVLPDDDDTLDQLDAMSVEDRKTATLDLPGFYKHIVYRAHDEEKCLGRETHGKDAPAWPDGCLLDPKRLPWRELRNIQSSKPEVFAVWYQQEDADPQKTLVKKTWVSGGTDPEDGTHHPGCWDSDRGLCELPMNLIGPKISYATVDPSPTKMWAIQWWVYCPEAGNQLFLMDTIRRSMPGNELLDWNNNDGVFYGVMEEWQQRSVDADLKIQTWIIEVNAAQRFLLQYDHVRRWQSARAVSIVPHTTTIRKSDALLGVDMVRDWWRFGRIRLPGRGIARTASLKLVEEVQRFPNAYTDDQVMAHWFGITRLPELSAGWGNDAPPVFQRPSWARNASRGSLVAV